MSNEELASQAHNIAKHQNGCRFLQKKLEENPFLARTLFFPSVLGYINELSNAQFGHYFIKKLILYLNEDELLQFIAIIFPVLPNIATNQYGTRVLQDFIDYLKNEKLLNSFIKVLLPHVAMFINDLNASYIIYKLILLNSEYNVPIHEKINSSINEIATNRKGCQFLKKYLETVDENKIKILVDNIYKNLDCIIMDQYGNYLIQNLILENNPAINKENILNEIIKNVVKYSNQKFASNVVEKCFELNEEIKEKIINEILKKENFDKMLLDNYGNYVVQKAINKTEGETQDKFLKMIVDIVHNLEKVNFGQKLLSKLLIQYPKLKLFMLNLSA
jgi:hypothetical protein